MLDPGGTLYENIIIDSLQQIIFRWNIKILRQKSELDNASYVFIWLCGVDGDRFLDDEIALPYHLFCANIVGDIQERDPCKKFKFLGSVALYMHSNPESALVNNSPNSSSMRTNDLFSSMNFLNQQIWLVQDGYLVHSSITNKVFYPEYRV